MKQDPASKAKPLYIKQNPKSKEGVMSLKDILIQLVEANEPVLLNDGNQDWEASALLDSLSEPRLKTAAHMQTGLYIAEINPKGYLGRILFRVKEKA